MAELVQSGAIISFILALVAAEILVFAWLCRQSEKLPNFWVLLPNLAAGGILMLTIKLALTGADWYWIAAGLAAAGIAHLLDLRARLMPG